MAAVLEHADLPKITDSYRQRYSTILENQERMKEDAAFLNESSNKRNWFKHF